MGGVTYDAERIEAYFVQHPDELSAHVATVASSVASLVLAAVGGALATLAKGVLSRGNSALEWARWRRALAPRVADTLVCLGPSYIKFGQSLASRADLVSVEIATELLRLQDGLPPFDAKVARGILEAELRRATDGAGAEELLRSLEEAEPVAAASLGQVYKGCLRGRPVAVKVQRPGVRRAAAADAALLRLLARWVASLRWPDFVDGFGGQRLVRADAVGAVDEFCSRLFEELDYTREAGNLRRFAELYGEGGVHASQLPHPGVRVPGLEESLCSRRVIVMEWVDGERLVESADDGSCAVLSAEDLPLVELGISATLVQLLEIGVMHTDPHGGNLLKGRYVPTANAGTAKRRWPWRRAPMGEAPQYQLVYLDFGLIAEIPVQVREGLVCAVMYMVQRRYSRVALLFNQLMLLPDWVLADKDMLDRFTADVEEAADKTLVFPGRHGGIVLSADQVPTLKFAALLEQLALLAPRYEFQLPPYFLNNARALGCLEGMARTADPQFNILSQMYPWALRWLLSNPTRSPVIDRTLRDLVSDPAEPERLSGRAALDLLAAAAAMQGTSRRAAALDVLRFPGGRAFAAQVARDEFGRFLRLAKR